MSEKTENPTPRASRGNNVASASSTNGASATTVNDAANAVDSGSASSAAGAAVSGGTRYTAMAPLTPDVEELVSELKDTVKQLSVRRLNNKTLRRALVSVRAILDDIDTLYQSPAEDGTSGS